MTYQTEESRKPKSLSYGGALVLLGVVCLSIFASYFALSAAKAEFDHFWTDKPDYTADEDMYLSGTGFAPDSALSVDVTGPDGAVNASSIMTDAAGNFDFYFLIGETVGNYRAFVTDDNTSFTLDIPVIENHAPEILNTPASVATVGQTYSHQVEAVDADGHEMTYKLLSAPEGMSIGAKTGLLEWTPSDAQGGLHEVIIQVSDIHSSTFSQIFNIYVGGQDGQ